MLGGISGRKTSIGKGVGVGRGRNERERRRRRRKRRAQLQARNGASTVSSMTQISTKKPKSSAPGFWKNAR
jgi:hypothetical protein